MKINLKTIITAILGILWIVIFYSKDYVCNHATDIPFIRYNWWLIGNIVCIILSTIGFKIAKNSIVKVLFILTIIFTLFQTFVLAVIIYGGSLV